MQLPKTVRHPDLLRSTTEHLLYEIWTHRYLDEFPITMGDYATKVGKQYRRYAIQILNNAGYFGITPAQFYNGQLHRRSRLHLYPHFKTTLQNWDLKSPNPKPPRNNSMEAFNGFLAKHHIDGCPQPVLSRFLKGKKGNRYGRLHAQGFSYQQMPKQARQAGISIDGVKVAEVDISASHLTTIAANKGINLPSDPYAIEGIPRDVVKAWMVIAIHSHRLPHSWYQSKRVQSKGIPRGFPKYPTDVQDKILTAYPWLKNFDWDSSEIFWQESEVMLSTIYKLVEMDIVALPLHDSIIVPINRTAKAREILETEFERIIGVKPHLKTTATESLLPLRGRAETPAVIESFDEMVQTVMGSMGCSIQDGTKEAILSVGREEGKAILPPKTNLNGTPPLVWGGRRYSKDKSLAEGLLLEGVGIRETAKRCGLGVATVHRLRASLQID
jgi:hypothetical protein